MRICIRWRTPARITLIRDVRSLFRALRSRNDDTHVYGVRVGDRGETARRQQGKLTKEGVTAVAGSACPVGLTLVTNGIGWQDANGGILRHHCDDTCTNSARGAQTVVGRCNRREFQRRRNAIGRRDLSRLRHDSRTEKGSFLGASHTPRFSGTVAAYCERKPAGREDRTAG